MLDIKPADSPLPEKEFIRHIDKLMETGQLNPDILSHLDRYQTHTVWTIKKYYNRQRNKEKGLWNS